MAGQAGLERAQKDTKETAMLRDWEIGQSKSPEGKNHMGLRRCCLELDGKMHCATRAPCNKFAFRIQKAPLGLRAPLRSNRPGQLVSLCDRV